jgi:methionine-rich copper-binding protein CopC
MAACHRIAPFVLIGSMLLGAPSAFPHALVVRSNPSANATVQTVPREVAIFFSERIQATRGSIVVEDTNGLRVDDDDSRVDANGRVVRVTLKALSAGTYKVTWRVQSVDTHKSEGTFIFRVQK